MMRMLLGQRVDVSPLFVQSMEFRMLHTRGAFLLPSRVLGQVLCAIQMEVL